MTELDRTLATWLAGEFDNRTQAMDQPAWFVQLRLWHRPLPQRLEGQLAIFAEQANALQLDKPYRQRILMIQPVQSAAEPQLQVQYLALRQPEQFRGGGADPTRLASLTPEDWQGLPGCCLTVAYRDRTFVAEMPPDTHCYFDYAGQRREVVLGFEARQTEFFSRDRGVDPDTGASLWGALMGAYHFHKREDWSSQLPD
jgi:hypothetical protein